MKFEDKRVVFWAIIDRYNSDSVHEKLLKELQWLKSSQNLLLKEIESTKGKVSGYCLKELNELYLNKAIQKLEATKERVQSEQEGKNKATTPIQPNSLLSLLTTLEPIPDDFPDVDEGLLSPDDVSL
ncbi:MAG: hypothetical protein SW833_22715 [Cyanobacteriota bacterium]|nr:hypothetical protein [Cyanobacteriota bacterium]